MGRFAEKYSDQQRAAIARAMVDEGMTGPDVMRAASRGELAEGLEPFHLPRASAYAIASAERQQRRGDTATIEMVDSMTDRTVQLLSRELDRLERKSKRGELELERMRLMPRMLKELRHELTERQPGGPSPEPSPPSPPDNGDASGRERLLAEVRQRAASRAID